MSRYKLKSILKEMVNESRESIMSKVAHALSYDTKPMRHKDFLGLDNGLTFVRLPELRLSLVNKDKTLLFYRDNGDDVEIIEEYDINQLSNAIDAISAYIAKNYRKTNSPS